MAGFIRGRTFPQREDQRCEERSRPAAVATEGELKSKTEMCSSKDASPLSFPQV